MKCKSIEFFDPTRLTFGDKTLVSSSTPIAGVAFASFVSYTRDKSRTPRKKTADNEFYGVIKITKAADISFALPRWPVSLEINGRCTHDFTSTQAGLIQLNLEPGTHKLRFTLRRMRTAAKQNSNSSRLAAGVGKVVTTPLSAKSADPGVRGRCRQAEGDD